MLDGLLTFPTASTEGIFPSISKSTPLLLCHLVAMKDPVPASYNCPEAGGFSQQRAATNGATYSGFIARTSSSGRTVRVMLVPAEGATALTIMLYLRPSRAAVLVNPTIPHFYHITSVKRQRQLSSHRIDLQRLHNCSVQSCLPVVLVKRLQI